VVEVIRVTRGTLFPRADFLVMAFSETDLPEMPILGNQASGIRSSQKPISRIVNRTSLRASRTLRICRPAPKQGHDMW
jgi:hypothetical protein